MELSDVRAVSGAVHAAHRFIYLVPEVAEEARHLGVIEPLPAYFAFRSAPLGAVSWQVALATFYNFSPRAVATMSGVWSVASPERWQEARFSAARRAMTRAGVSLSEEELAEAREIVDPVVAGAELAARPLAAANAAVPLPSDQLVALWQQITVLREWRGDAHVGVLDRHDIGPCASNVLQAATGRFPGAALARATRKWDDNEWQHAVHDLAGRGWLNPDGTATDEGQAAREQVELETDALSARLWAPVTTQAATRLGQLLAPIVDRLSAVVPV